MQILYLEIGLGIHVVLYQYAGVILDELVLKSGSRIR